MGSDSVPPKKRLMPRETGRLKKRLWARETRWDARETLRLGIGALPDLGN